MSSVSRWDRVLTETALSVKITRRQLRHVKYIARPMIEALRRQSNYKIDRLYLAGSVGKKTDIIIKPDYDYVIFVNRVRPPFEDVISDFERVITGLPGITIRNKVAKKPRKVLQVTIEGLKFDIAPAVNFTNDKIKQRSITIQQMKGTNEAYLYSSCLAESALAFIKAQSSFVHMVIRVAKYWNKLHVPDTFHISARSSVMECIAVYVGREEENHPDGGSISVAFKAFLEMIRDFPTINITFNMFYSPNEISDAISSQRPLVMDPTNPYNNLAHSFFKKPEVMSEFQQVAKVTLRRLNEIVHPDRNSLFAICT